MCAFDVIELDGADLRRSPIEERKQRLAAVLRQLHHGIAFNETYGGDGAVIYQHACDGTPYLLTVADGEVRSPFGSRAWINNRNIERGIGEIEMNADPKHKGGYDDVDRAKRARRHQETYTWGAGLRGASVYAGCHRTGEDWMTTTPHPVQSRCAYKSRQIRLERCARIRQ